MRNFVMTLALAGVTLTGLATAPALYAQEPKGLDGSMKGGPDMQHMKKMMEMCGNMMQGGMMAAPAAGEAEQVVSLTPAELTWTAGPPMLPPSASMAVI